MSAKLPIRKEPHPQLLPACREVSSSAALAGWDFKYYQRRQSNEKNLSAMHKNMVASTRSSADFKVPT
jgi:hypothetical protein